jgi:hypothetical protein
LPTDPLASPEPVREGASERPTVTEVATVPAPTIPLAAPDGQVGRGLVMPHAAAVARSDGSVVLLADEPGSSTSTALATALLGRGTILLAEGTSVLDPDTLEVLPEHGPDDVLGDPLEVRLLIFPEHTTDAAGTHVQVLSGSEAAYLVGARSAGLDDVTGGPLPALARLARRVPAYRLRYDDVARAAEEVLRLWPTP